jgi:hypothetical protein
MTALGLDRRHHRPSKDITLRIGACDDVFGLSVAQSRAGAYRPFSWIEVR